MEKKTYLSLEETGIYFVDIDENGVRSEPRPTTTEEAFAFIQRVIEEPDRFHVRADTDNPDELKRIVALNLTVLILHHSRKLEASGSTEEEWVQDTRRLVGSPEALWTLQHYAADQPVVARIWPELVDPNAQADETLIRGDADQGTGPLPDQQGAHAPPPVKPQPGTGGGTTPDGARAGDPVLPASGQFLLEEVDLEVEGIGLDFRWERVYLHNVDYEGQLGPRWDHSYNLWLREATEARVGGGLEYVVYRSNGRLKAERFVLEGELETGGSPGDVTDAVFLPPAGIAERLEKRGGRFVLVSPDGKRVEYNENLRAERLTDLNGNQIRLRYSEDPRRLVEIVDTCGRSYRLAYEDGRIIELLDTSLDRSVRYAYDFQGRLTDVRHSTGVSGQEPRTKCYRYWGNTAPAGMDGNIVGVIDPRGIEVFQVRYGSQPGLLSYNRVVEQRNGGVTLFDYETVVRPTPNSTDQPFNAPVIRVRMEGPSGQRFEMEYNTLGRMLRHAVTEFSLTGPQTIETRWSYNADGRVVREERPGGGVLEYTYGRERFVELGGDETGATTTERMRFGELLKVIEHARPGSDVPPQRVTEFDYHPTFGFIVEQRGPYYADLNGVRIDDGAPFATRLEYDPRGNLVRVEYPDVTLPDGSIQGGRHITLNVDERGRVTRRSLSLEPGVELATEFFYPQDDERLQPQPSATVMDADGLKLERQFQTDAAGRIVRAEEPSGRETMRKLDHLGRLLEEEVSTAAGGTPSKINTIWAPHDRPLRVTLNRVDASGVEDPDSMLERNYTFDAEGEVAVARLVSADGRIDRETRHEHGPGGETTRVVVGQVTTSMKYNNRGQLIEQTVEAPGVPASTNRLFYDVDGWLTAMEDGTGRRETVRHDGFGRVNERISPGGTEVHSEFDASDRLLRRTVIGSHPDHVESVKLKEEYFDWDEGGRLREFRLAVFDPATGVGEPQLSATTYYRDTAGRVTRIEGPTGFHREYTYDGAGRRTRVSDNTGTTEEWHYDDVQRTVRHELVIDGTAHDGASHTQTRVWTSRLDGHGKLVEQVDALGNTNRFEWDSRGHLSASVDPDGIRREELVEPDGAVREVRAAAGTSDEVVWQYHRDALGNVTSLEGPRGNLLSIQRDALGQPTEIRFGPEGLNGSTSLVSDELGRVVRSEDGRGVVTEITYNDQGLPSRINSNRSAVVGPPGVADFTVDGPDEVVYQYDGVGQLTSADDGTLTVTRRHDSRGRLLRETVEGTTVEWSYDMGGYPSSFRFPDGRLVEYQRDVAGRLTSIAEAEAGDSNPAGAAPGSPLIEQWAIGPDSVLAQRWRGLVIREEYADHAGRLLRVAEQAEGNDTSLLQLRRLYDARGMARIRQTALAGADVVTEVIVSDAQGRLNGVSRTSGTELASTSDLEAGPSSEQSVQDSRIEQIVSEVEIPPAVEFQYFVSSDGVRERSTRFEFGELREEIVSNSDAAGRITSVGDDSRIYDGNGLVSQAAETVFTYDVFGSWTGIREETSIVLLRDPLGRPHRLTTDDSNYRFVYDGNRVVEVRSGDTPVVHYLRDDDTGDILEFGTEGAAFRPLRDPDGSVLGLADATGSLMGSNRFDPFGGVESDTDMTAGLQFAFHGMLSLPGTDFRLAGGRLYESATGSFLQPDPLGFVDGISLYQYARCNPFAFSDEFGLMANPVGKTGRGGGTGGHHAGGSGGMGTHKGGGGLGDDRELRWYERGLLAMGGAITTVVDSMIVEPLKMVYDYVGLYIQVVGIATGWWDYDHDVASGIGHKANDGLGTGEILAGMGRNMIKTPERMWDAMERGDYWGFGAESMNLYMTGRAVEGTVRASATWLYNRGIKATGRLSQAEPATAPNYEHMFRGAAGEEGVGILYVRDVSALTPAQRATTIRAIRDMDFQAGMSGGFVRQQVTPHARSIGNRVARFARRALRLDRSQHAGHLPDIAAGGDPIGVIMGIPAGVNRTWGGQMGGFSRYQPGFRFTGFSLVDRATGQFLYPSLSLETAPLSLSPW